MRRSRAILLAAVVGIAALASFFRSDAAPCSEKPHGVSFRVRTNHCRIAGDAPPLRVHIDCS
jgi:hypothetical protein